MDYVAQYNGRLSILGQERAILCEKECLVSRIGHVQRNFGLWYAIRDSFCIFA